MIISGSNIRSLCTITHDGKVVAFGTAPDGTIYYSVKRSGFEDSAVRPAAEPFGFEDWKPLRLGESAPDASVIAADLDSYTDQSGTLLLRSVYGNTPEVMTTIDAPVQVLSALGQLCVFRQAPTGKILVSRFVLDGMANELVPKLEVRFRRSGQRLTPDQSASASSGVNFDNLDYRDIDGKSFFEPCLELGFVGPTANGWFAPVFVPTVESDRFRWHVFAYDPVAQRLLLHSCGAEHTVFFDVKDYLYGMQDPADPENTIYRIIPGLTRRSLDLTGLTVVGGPAVSTYTLQHEQITDQGPQLVRDAMRIMLAVPVKTVGSDVVKTAVLTFALAKDGGLSQIDLTPDSSTILKSSVREVITPLTLLDGIKEIATTNPPPAGTIVATERGDGDLLRLRTVAAVPADLATGAQVKVTGTRSYDGHYKVLATDGTSFQVAASFANNEAGRFEVVPAVQTGLVFNDMVVGGERTADGKLLIRCPAHDLSVGDEVQISGTQQYNGIFPISAIDAGRAAFTLDTPYFTGEAANLSKVVRRGLRMATGDRLETPALSLSASQPDRDLGRTLSAWVRLDVLGTVEQNLIRDGGGLLSLAIGSDSKARLTVRMSDGTTQTVVDPSPILVNTWVHFSSSLGYRTATGGNTTLSLCRDGVEVAALTIPHGLPAQLNNLIINFDGVDDGIELGQNPPNLANGSYSVELWLRRGRSGVQEFAFWQGTENLLNGGLHVGFRSNDVFAFGTWGNDLNTTVACSDNGWHHYACTYNHLTRTKRAYRDGVLIGELVTDSHYLGSGVPFIGRFASGLWPFQGNIADVRLWSRAREQAEIVACLNQRLSGREQGLIANWPLDNGTARDLSPAKRHGVLRGGASFTSASYLYPQAATLTPQPTLDGFTKFDGGKDSWQTPAFATPSAALTVSVWARSNTATWNTFACLLSKRYSFIMHPWSGERRLEFMLWSSGGSVTLSFVPDNIQGWHQYTATYDGSSACLYMDGVLVAKAPLTGAIAPDASGLLCIGHDDDAGPLDRNFGGQLADVQLWSRARSQTEIQQSLRQKLRGTEPGLFAYWPLALDGNDRGQNQLHATPCGAPQPINTRGCTIGGTFNGEIASAQLWDRVRSPAEVNATMHLLLDGKEAGLGACYPLGAVAYAERPPRVIDFSSAGAHALVYGSPYAGARRLNRQLGSGLRAIKFSSSELVAVSAHGIYEESLEFRLACPDPAFDPNNADGTGRKLFTFTYFGKSSLGQKDTVLFPAGNAQQSDFQRLGNGWYRATCQVIIPDGVRLMRAFELGDLRGRWSVEASPPVNEWTSLEVRRHHLRLISDAISRDAYTDAAALPVVAIQTPALQSSLIDLGRSEFKVGRAEQLIADLTARIDVAQNAVRYTAEKASLGTKLTGLQAQRATAQTDRNALVADPYSYYHRFRVKHSQLVASLSGSSLMQVIAGNTDAELFRIQSSTAYPGWFNLYNKTDNSNLLAADPGDAIILQAPSSATSQNWIWADFGGGNGTWMNQYFGNRVFDVYLCSLAAGTRILHWPWNGGLNQQWTREKTTELTSVAKTALAAKDTLVASLDAQITATQQRIDWLTLALGATETVAALQTQLTAAQTSLASLRTELVGKNSAVMGALSATSPVSMAILATDDRDLSTSGAVLDFVNPQGRLELLESAEGNVLLSYMDLQGRLRVLPFDVAMDRRNTAFEQWLPEGVRACADLRDPGDKVALSAAVTLPSGAWTCEAWVLFPLATLASGQPSTYNAVAAGDTRSDAPVVIARGNRLGAMIDGWFFDSGVDLTRTVTLGWHHVAATASASGISFYLDGVKVGSSPAAQPSLRLGGTADWVEVPAYPNPTAALTVSVWARSSGPTWNNGANLVSKRDAFIMHPVPNTRDIAFYIIAGPYKSVTYTMPDIEGWHLYTGTYDGTNLLLFVDGELRATLPVTGAITADTGVMLIGNDDCAPNPNNRPFAGDIAEVSVWSVARSASDIKGDLYRSFKGDEAGLVGYWRMTQITDGGVLKVKDLSPNARHGVVKGAPLDSTLSTQRPIDIKLLGNLPAGTSPIGRLAEVRLWSLALSADEVAANARVSLSGNEPGLLGYFPLNEASGQVAGNRCPDALASGTLTGVDWMGCTAPIGNLGGQLLSLPDRGGGYVSCPPLALSGKSFTIECWARRSGGNLGTYMAMVGGGNVNVQNQILWFGFTNTNRPLLAFNGNDLEAWMMVTDSDWHHFCATHDQPTKKQRLYCDGLLVGERISPTDFGGSSTLYLGKTEVAGSNFCGNLAEVRIWDRARTEVEVRGSMQKRATGTEVGLLACYPLNEVTSGGQVREKKSGLLVGQLQGSAQVLLSTTLPLSGADTVVVNEYSAVDLTPDGRKQALMRRALGFVSGGTAQLLAEQRIEELTLQWVGNTQINPTLLGYIEGAPPVPSENLTEEDDYNDATVVTLKQSETTSYSWHRSEATSQAFSMEGFIGASWEVEGGIGVVTKLAEGRVGAAMNYEHEDSQDKSSTVTATSTLMTADSLVLTGMPEENPAFAALGARFVPKNVGYALVISGMADVFVTKLKRSGRMVSYDIRPVDGVPLDVNTITFLINPAYTLNGSLDGQVGSSAADPIFYPQVPAMRAQYGSLYPASYFRLKEAYALKEAIERQDKERESFFYNFQADQLPPLGAMGAGTSTPSVTSGGSQSDQQKKDAADVAEKRQGDISAKQQSLQGKLRAGAAFADWQVRMAGIQTKAGKRNVVNTYVWDADGGMRAEEQSFASTVEHSLSTETRDAGGLGFSAETMTAGVSVDLSLMGSGSKASGTEKTLSSDKSLELTVELGGIEKDGVTDRKDNPLVPGEKVDRYRFMTFYLEGSTDHFNDFFSYVVDPEWLASNSEEARSLRQARGAKPNKSWRVLHRVTYVERPALTQGEGRDPRQNGRERQAELRGRLNGLERKVDAIIAKL